MDQAGATDLEVHLVARHADSGDYRIYPRELLARPIDSDMPEALRARRTVRLVFDSASLAAVPAGLYDLRFEAHQNGALARDAAGRPVSELQYNAVRVFDSGPADNGGRYSVVSLSDTQIAVGNMDESDTLPKLHNFVDFLSTTTDKRIRGAAFIIFNGDLHNSGSPTTLSSAAVASTYLAEARAILGELKNLPLPIFLVPGNHDGDVSMGDAPEMISLKEDVIGKSMKQVVQAAQTQSPWPGLTADAFEKYLDETGNALGGRHVDLVTGRYTRHAGATTWHDGWTRVPDSQRNLVL